MNNTNTNTNNLPNVSNVWSINASIENVRENQPFIELAGRYKDFKIQYGQASAAHEAAYAATLDLENNSRSTQDQIQAAVRREQHYRDLMTRMHQNMQTILSNLGMSDEELEARYHRLTTNISFANNPRYRNLWAAVRDLYPGLNVSNEDLEALIRGNVYIPNNEPENTETIAAKKSRARAALATVTARGGKRRNRRKSTSRGGQQNTTHAGSLLAELLEIPVGPGYYTFIAWDEIPNPALAPGYLHALVKNIRVGDNGKLRLDQGTTLVPYQPPSPPAGSGQHTYHFALYKQSSPTLATNARNTRRAKYNRNARVRNLGLQFVTHRAFTSTV